MWDGGSGLKKRRSHRSNDVFSFTLPTNQKMMTTHELRQRNTNIKAAKTTSPARNPNDEMDSKSRGGSAKSIKPLEIDSGYSSPWSPSFSVAWKLLLASRLAAATLSNIAGESSEKERGRIGGGKRDCISLTFLSLEKTAMKSSTFGRQRTICNMAGEW